MLLEEAATLERLVLDEDCVGTDEAKREERNRINCIINDDFLIFDKK